MHYRKLGASGLDVSVIGLGTNNFGRRVDAAGTKAVLDCALDKGVNFIDTANAYGGGASEEFIGRAIEGKRDQYVIATKAALKVGDGPNQSGASRQHLFTEVEKSLKRLRTDHVDLYQIHVADPYTPIEETLGALSQLIDQGKVRYAGCSNYAAWQLCEAMWTARTKNLAGFVSVQPPYNMLDRGIERELLPCCQRYGVGILPYFPLANGFLTGKYRRGDGAPEGTRLAEDDRGMLTEANFDILERLEAFAVSRDHTLLELAFAWLLANKAVSSVIAGATRPEQIVANAAAAGWELSLDDMAQIDTILTPRSDA